MENPFKKLSKPEIYAVIGGTVLIGGYFTYQHHKTTGSWNPFSKGTATTGSGTDPVTGMAYSQDNVTDPITGQTYLAEAEQYGSVAAAEASVSAYGTTTATGSGIPVNPVSPGSAPPAATSSGQYTTNDQWVQAVQGGLTEVGYDLTTVNTALQAYLAAQPLTPDQAKVVRFALAEYGNPPVGSFTIVMASTTPTGKTMVKIPDVANLDVEQASKILVAEGLKASGPKGIPHVLHIVTSTSPAIGTSVVSGSSVTLHYKTEKE